MIEQFDDKNIDRPLKDAPPIRQFADMTPEEQAAVRARIQKREEEKRYQEVRREVERLWKCTIPERYQNVRLNTLEPTAKSHMPEEKQKVIIDIMRNAPNDGYCLLGPQGWSKSTFLYALYRRALFTNAYDIAGPNCRLYRLHPVVYCEAKELMDRIQAWKIGDADAPEVTAKKIERLKVDHGITTHLFLDEFEKVKKSEFRMAEMYDIINACYKHNAQLVIAGNMTKADLDDKNQYLEGTFRRIEDLTTPHFWEFGGK